ncbi:HotDog domain-containing protein [Nemania sp. FL0916]|nr:HotDog domain-containing protein [Nemania sp. FL0916]
MSYFASIPWCATMLQQPGIVTFTPMARLPAGSDGRFPSQDQLFKTSLKTADTVPEYLGFYQSPFSDANHLSVLAVRPPRSGPQFLINTMSLLVDLRPGVNGFNGTAHGGLIASIMDEVMGCLVFKNSVVQREMQAKGMVIPGDVLDMTKAGPAFTASMNVKFIKPIPTPQVVIATATLSKIDSKKIYLSHDIKDEKGKMLAAGEGTWVILPKERL